MGTFLLSLLIIICYFSLANSLPAYINRFLKEPVNYELKFVKNCAPDGLWPWYHDVKIEDGTMLYLAGNGTLDRDLDDNVKLSFEVQKWRDNKWIPIVRVLKDAACAAIMDVLDDDFVLLTHMIGARTKTCPIPKNTYKIEGILVDLRETIANRFMAGQYTVKLAFYGSKNETLSCLRLRFISTKRNS